MQRLIKILFLVIVIIYSSYAYLFFFQTGFTNFKPLYWHFITIIFALSLLASKVQYGLPGLPRSLGIWLWLFLCNSIVCFLYSRQGEGEIQALIESFQITVLFYSFYILFQIDGAIRISRLALIVVVLFSVSMNFIDFFMSLWSNVTGRGAGLYLNPTIAGKMLVLTMVASVPLVPRKFRLLYCLFAGSGVFLTFSRGPWAFWVLAVAGLSVTGYLKLGRKGLSIVATGFLVSIFLYSLLTGGILDLFVSTGLDDYLTPGTLARLGGSGPIFSDYSAMSRADAAARAWAIFSDHPWFGAGLGHDQHWEVGAHNTYLRMAAEGGLFRLSIFVGLIVILWRLTDNIGRVTLIVYAASSMTSHDNLRQPALLVILALIAASKRKNSTEL